MSAAVVRGSMMLSSSSIRSQSSEGSDLVSRVISRSMTNCVAVTITCCAWTKTDHACSCSIRSLWSKESQWVGLTSTSDANVGSAVVNRGSYRRMAIGYSVVGYDNITDLSTLTVLLKIEP